MSRGTVRISEQISQLSMVLKHSTQASRFVFDTTHVNWDGSAFVVKSQINEFAAGPVKGGTRVKFELNDILGLKAGDYVGVAALILFCRSLMLSWATARGQNHHIQGSQ